MSDTDNQSNDDELEDDGSDSVPPEPDADEVTDANPDNQS